MLSFSCSSRKVRKNMAKPSMHIAKGISILNRNIKYILIDNLDFIILIINAYS